VLIRSGAFIKYFGTHKILVRNVAEIVCRREEWLTYLKGFHLYMKSSLVFCSIVNVVVMSFPKKIVWHREVLAYSSDLHYLYEIKRRLLFNCYKRSSDIEFSTENSWKCNAVYYYDFIVHTVYEINGQINRCGDLASSNTSLQGRL